MNASPRKAHSNLPEGTPSAPPDGSGVRGVDLALGQTGPVRLQLLPNPSVDDDAGDGSTESLKTISRGGRTSRVYDAMLVDGDGRPVVRLALKVQRPEVMIGNTPGEKTAAAADRQWALRAAQVRRFSGAAGGLPRSINLLDGGRVGPLLYCREKQFLFAPRSGASFQRLKTFRDEALTAEWGLPSADESPVRWLHAVEDAGKEGRKIYTDAEVEQQAAGVAIGSEGDCLRDQGLVVAARETIERDDPALHRELLRTFPCYDCDEAKNCYPKGGGVARVLDRVVPFVFHEAGAWYTEQFDLAIDSVADLIGGRPAAELSPAVGRQDVLARLLRAPRWLLHEDGSPGRLIREVLWLKWCLLARAVEQLLTLYRACGRPHLNLAPRHVVVQFGAAAGHAPLLWHAAVGLIGVDGAIPISDEDSISSAGVYRPLWPESMYAHPLMVERLPLIGKSGAGSLTIEKLEPGEGDGGRTVRAQFRWASGHWPGRVHDKLWITLPGESGPSLACRVLGISGETWRIAGPAPAELALNEGDAIESATAVFYPRHGLVEDLYALGVLALRVLLVNRKQDMATVLSAVNGGRAQSAWSANNLLFDSAGDGPGAGRHLSETLWQQVQALVSGLLDGSAVNSEAPDGYAPESEAKILRGIHDSFVNIERALEGQHFGHEGMAASDRTAVVNAMRAGLGASASIDAASPAME